MTNNEPEMYFVCCYYKYTERLFYTMELSLFLGSTIYQVPLNQIALLSFILNQFYLLTFTYSMPSNDSSLQIKSKRNQSIRKLTSLFSKIEFLELNQQDFPTEHIHQLSHFAQYSIHPIFSDPNTQEIYTKLAQRYWKVQENPHLENLSRNTTKSSYNIKMHDQQLEPQIQSLSQNNQISNITKQNLSNTQNSQSSQLNLPTETFSSPKQVQISQKVTKSYHQIQKLLLSLNHQEALQNQKIAPKIQLLNSWTSIPSQLPNFITKKSSQIPKRIDSTTYLENLKLGKQVRKDSISSFSSRSIILGKNQSTETKQIKHMLKVQAKTNFVEQKQKQESKLDILQKKSIELNYLLNVITKEFFNDFSQDILKILRENKETIKILCEKVIQKVKEQHNFIEIYVDLIKSLCKLEISQEKTQSQKGNELQVHFVSFLQKSFTKLIQSKIEPSSSNFNEYKFQKEIVGMSQFIGKLIKQKVLSRKIFKVCFWQILYRYVQKVKQNPDQEIVNQCLIEAIVTISDSMSNFQLLKLIQKQKENDQSKCMDEVIEINKFQRMMTALVNPNDEDYIKREEEYNNLIDSIKVEEYPHILNGLMQIFISKRMKLKFLVENWQQKIENLSNSTLEEETVKVQQHSQQVSLPNIQEETRQDFLEFTNKVKQFVKQIKHDPYLNGITQQNQTKNNKQLQKFQKLIIKELESYMNSKDQRKILQILITEFLKQFADCKNHNLGIKRIDYFFDFMTPIGFKDFYKIILETICTNELQNLMIIECDYPFLVEGLTHLLNILAQKVPIKRQQILQKMRNSFSQDDQDMNEFYGKINYHLNKTNVEKDEIEED